MDILNIFTTAVLSILGALGVTWAFVQYLGKRIIENEFSKAIESYKFRINSKFDRISKIHEKEFEVLPHIWKDLITTNATINSVTSHFQYSPDFCRLSRTEIEELYRSSELKPSEIEKIEQSSDKTKEYQLIEYWKKLNRIMVSYRGFVLNFQLNRIFLTKNIEHQLNEIRNAFAGICANIETAVSFSKIDNEYVGKAREEQDKVQDKIDAVGNEIQSRLCFSEAYQDNL